MPTIRPGPSLFLMAALLGGFELGLLHGPSKSVIRAQREAPARRRCTCIPPDVPTALNQAAAVFHGQVTGFENPAPPNRGTQVVFAVRSVWGRRDVTEVAHGIVANLFSDCIVEFRLGQDYIVYASTAEDGSDGFTLVKVPECSRTDFFFDTEADRLGPGRPPSQLTPPATDTPSPTPWPTAPPPACPRCAAPPYPRELLQTSALVFTGRVAERVERPDEGWRLSLRFDVASVWTSGLVGEVAWLELPWSVWGCGGEPQVGEDWLVYAEKDAEGRWTHGLCSRSHRLVEDDPDLAELEPGCDPVGGIQLMVEPDTIRAGEPFVLRVLPRNFLLREVTSLSVNPPDLASVDPPRTMPCPVCKELELRALGPGLARIDVAAFGESFSCRKGPSGLWWDYPRASITLAIGEGSPGGMATASPGPPLPPSVTPAPPDPAPDATGGRLWLPRLHG